MRYNCLERPTAVLNLDRHLQLAREFQQAFYLRTQESLGLEEAFLLTEDRAALLDAREQADVESKEDLERLGPAYTSSKYWKWLKSRAQQYCEVCLQSGPRLTLHHTTYDYIGDEDESRLVVVCGPCHNAIHKPLSVAAGHQRRWLSKLGWGDERLFEIWFDRLRPECSYSQYAGWDERSVQIEDATWSS